MENTYEIVDATVNHPEKGMIVKQNIIFYNDGKEFCTQLWSAEGVIVGKVIEGYKPINKE